MTLLVNILGWSGTIAVLWAYVVVTVGWHPARSVYFQGLNLYGSIGLMTISLYYHVFPNVALNLVWGAIALVALVGLWRGRKKAPKATHCFTCGTRHVQNGIACPGLPYDAW